LPVDIGHFNQRRLGNIGEKAVFGKIGQKSGGNKLYQNDGNQKIGQKVARKDAGSKAVFLNGKQENLGPFG
jgi:hypothetical protein